MWGGGGGGGGQGDLSYLIVGRSAVAPASNLKGCWDQFCDFLLDYFEEFQLKKTVLQKTLNIVSVHASTLFI